MVKQEAHGFEINIETWFMNHEAWCRSKNNSYFRDFWSSVSKQIWKICRHKFLGVGWSLWQSWKLGKYLLGCMWYVEIRLVRAVCPASEICQLTPRRCNPPWDTILEIGWSAVKWIPRCFLLQLCHDEGKDGFLCNLEPMTTGIGWWQRSLESGPFGTW